MMDLEIIKDCTRLSEEEKILFPEVVSRLSNAGIELYYADLLASTKTYYRGNEAFVLPTHITHAKISSNNFDAEQISRAIKLSQSNQIKYQEFLNIILQAGVIAYFVFITGRKAVYLGRLGEQHVELFPTNNH